VESSSLCRSFQDSIMPTPGYDFQEGQGEYAKLANFILKRFIQLCAISVFGRRLRKDAV
jgi:hypothetical protein